MCAVCCAPPDHVRPAPGPACAVHTTRQRKYRGLTVRSSSRMRTSSRWRRSVSADGRAAIGWGGTPGLCRRCELAWRNRGRPELARSARTPRARGGGAGRADLAGRADRAAETGAAVRRPAVQLQKRKRSREAWRGLVRDARAAGVGSLLELERSEATCPWMGQVLMVGGGRSASWRCSTPTRRRSSPPTCGICARSVWLPGATPACWTSRRSRRTGFGTPPSGGLGFGRPIRRGRACRGCCWRCRCFRVACVARRWRA